MTRPKTYAPRREDVERTDREVIDAIMALPDEIPRISMPEWAEKKRIIPIGLSPIPGPYSYAVTPYIREIAEALSETSPIQYVAVMKGTRGGFSVGLVENWIGYTIDVSPGPMLYITADDDVLKDTMELRVDPMIELSGLRPKIFSQVQNKKNRKTGDTAKKKEFSGGYLLGFGPNSGAKLRNWAGQKIAFDEVEAYPLEIKGEGDPLAIAEKRANEWGDSKKILYISTPAVKQSSRILTKYLEGDQRKLYVPCKHCGEMQVLVWKQLKFERDKDGRLVFDLDAEGKPIKGTGHVWYECAACGKHWRNEDKAYFLPRGQWRPTAKASRPLSVSYHWTALASPVAMYHWEDAALEWIAAQGDMVKTQAFINTVLGEPWEEVIDAPPVDRVMLRRQDYAPERLIFREDGSHEWLDAILPPGPLVLTLGGDVQHDRIEVELVAWGRDKENWSVGYHILPGDTSDPTSGPWLLLKEILFRRTHGGLRLAIALIDSGDQSPVVYAFCDSLSGGVYPSKGADNTMSGLRVFRESEVTGHHCHRVDLDTSQLKTEFYAATRVGPVDAPPVGTELPPGYCHFPRDDDNYNRRYFEKLYAERRVQKRTASGATRYVWDAGDRRNEALDCRVYALGGLYVVASACTAPPDDKKGEVNWALFWDMMEAGRNG